MNKIDMSWGSPAFLIPYWELKKMPPIHSSAKEMVYSVGSRSSLKNAIIDLHQQEKNAAVDGKHIVVGPGATSLILGLLRIISKRTGAKSAWATPPHFSRFPYLAEYAGLKWEKRKNSVWITTIPNNPNGASLLFKNTSILDLTYNWQQYTPAVKEYNHPVMVFSLSKATGHASTRIGWAIIEDDALAFELERYIEYSTSGLSLEAQTKAEQVILSQINADYTVFEDGKKTLLDRWNLIEEIESKNGLPFKILNDQGMFLWAEGRCPKEIIGLDGRCLNGHPNTFRLNLGCSSESFIRFYNLFSDQQLDNVII